MKCGTEQACGGNERGRNERKETGEWKGKEREREREAADKKALVLRDEMRR